MSSSEFQIDLERLDDPWYIIQPDVFNYLLERCYQNDCFVYDYDGTDPQHILADKELYSKLFYDSLFTDIFDRDLFKYMIIDIISGYPLPKYYYHTYCVVCLENPSTISLAPCHHHCICSDCLYEFVVNKIETCPLCRSQIEAYTKPI